MSVNKFVDFKMNRDQRSTKDLYGLAVTINKSGKVSLPMQSHGRIVQAQTVYSKLLYFVLPLLEYCDSVLSGLLSEVGMDGPPN